MNTGYHAMACISSDPWLVRKLPIRGRVGVIRCIAVLCFLLVSLASSAADDKVILESQWTESAADGGQRVNLWFFWSTTCPHCRAAHPAIDKLVGDLPWLRLHSLRVDGRPENVQTFRRLAIVVGGDARSVPAFVFCGRMLVGWDGTGAMERELREGLLACRATGVVSTGEPGQPLSLPILGEVDPHAWSLPVFTVVIAALDSFNPCAFFVLLFLLSLLVHAGSRSRMLIIGGVFILISGVVYFLAMAAWLNLFTLVGHLPLVTLVAGLFAVLISLLNIKDFFWFKRGVSLSISNQHQGRLIQRMRNLLGSGSLPTMLLATVSLAIVANLYELLCTAGFPMVYTRLLTLHEMRGAGYYLYLLLYNAVYVVPLLLIMIAFVVTLGQRKLQEHEGRALKLMSGLMMLALGLTLIFVPQALSRPWFAALLLVGAVITTGVIIKVTALLSPD